MKHPDYHLRALNKETSGRTGKIGAAWANADGSVTLVIDPCVVLQCDPDIVLTLFPADKIASVPQKKIAKTAKIAKTQSDHDMSTNW